MVDVLVACAVRPMLAGVSVRLGPVGELEAVRFTVPVKLSMLDTMMVEFDLDPTGAITGLVGLTWLFAKPGFCWTVKSTGWSLKDSVIGIALVSLSVKPARFQFTSSVLVKE